MYDHVFHNPLMVLQWVESVVASPSAHLWIPPLRSGAPLIATGPRNAADLVEGLAVGIEMLTGPRRIVTAARLRLFMEANHKPEIRAAVSQTRRVMEWSMVAVMARLGATDPHPTALAPDGLWRGIILHCIARHDTTDSSPPAAGRRQSRHP
jgi:hypothetical protein